MIRLVAFLAALAIAAPSRAQVPSPNAIDIPRWFSETFLKHRHTDKEHQLRLLDESTDVCWIGVRPLQMKSGPKTGKYRLGYNAFSGLSSISFADCAHAMVSMLEDDTWKGKVPIVQY